MEGTPFTLFFPLENLCCNSCVPFILQVSQELNITERDPSYLNPYSKSHEKKQKNQQHIEEIAMNKRKKIHKRGPRMSSGTFTGEL